MEEGQVVGEHRADGAPGADFLAVGRGRFEVLVETAERVGIVGQLLRARGKEAGAPAGVQPEVRGRVPGQAQTSRGFLVAVIAGQGSDMVVHFASHIVVAQAEEGAPLGAHLDPVQDEDAGRCLGHGLVGQHRGPFDGVAQVGVKQGVDRLPAQVGSGAEMILEVGAAGRVIELDRSAGRVVAAVDDRGGHGFGPLGVAVEGGQRQIQVFGQGDGARQPAGEAARALIFVAGDAVDPEHVLVPSRRLFIFGQGVGVGVGQLAVEAGIGAEPGQVEPLGVAVVEIGVAEDGGHLDRGRDVEAELAVEIVGPEVGVVAVAAAGRVGAGDAVVHGPRRAADLGQALDEAERAGAEISVGGDRGRAAVVGQDVDDAAGGAAAVKGRRRSAQDLYAVDGGPIDVEEVRDEA